MNGVVVADRSIGGGPSVGRNALLLGAARVVPLAVLTLAMAVLARELSPSRFGILTFAVAVSSIAMTVIDGGLVTASIRDVVQGVVGRAHGFGALVTGRLVTWAATTAVAVAVLWLGLPEASSRVLIVSAVALQLLAATYAGSFQMLAQVDNAVSRFAFRDALGRTCAGVLILLTSVVLPARQLLAAAFICMALGSILSAALMVLAYRGPHLSLAAHAQYARAFALFRSSWPLALATLLNTIYFRLDALLLFWLSSPRQVGLYGFAYRILEVMLLIGGFYQAAFLPHVSGLRGSDFRRAVILGWTSLLKFGAPVLAVGVLLAPFVVRLLAGSSYNGSVAILQLLLPGALLSWLNSVGGAAFIAAGFERRALRINLAVLVVNAGANLALIPATGGLGAAVVCTLSEGAAFVLMAFYCRRFLGFRFRLSLSAVEALAIGALLAATTACEVFLPRSAQTIIGLSVGVAVVVSMAVRLQRELRRRRCAPTDATELTDAGASQ